jgi:hypothetical protein
MSQGHATPFIFIIFFFVLVLLFETGYPGWPETHNPHAEDPSECLDYRCVPPSLT